jgi:hypothetical protein
MDEAIPAPLIIQQSVHLPDQEEGEIGERSEEETNSRNVSTQPSKNPGRKSNNQHREAAERREIDMGKHSTLDIHTKKEPRPTRNQGGSAPPKGGNPKQSSK